MRTGFGGRGIHGRPGWERLHPGSAGDDALFTKRLRLDPVRPARARDLWLVHSDDEVWPWYGSQKPSLSEVEQQAAFMGDSWRFHGVHKWIAYDRVSGEVVGRGGIVAHARR